MSRRLGMVVMLLLAGLTLVSCSAAPPAPAVAGDVAEQAAEGSERQAAASSARDCAELDELGCLASTECTLRQSEDKRYTCTAPASDCERGFVQSAGRPEDCAAGCSFTPARCYCSPDVQCVCGGGPPAMCQAFD